MNKKLFSLFSVILFLPVLVLAQNLEQLLHIPSDYSTMPNLLYFVILPFLGTFAIIWGILTNVNIFKNYKVNVLLSLIFAFSLLYYGILLAITHYLFAFGGIFGVIAFFVLFFALSSLYTAKKIGEDYGETRKILKKYEKERQEKVKKIKEESKEKIKGKKKLAEELEETKNSLIKYQKEHEKVKKILIKKEEEFEKKKEKEEKYPIELEEEILKLRSKKEEIEKYINFFMKKYDELKEKLEIS